MDSPPQKIDGGFYRFNLGMCCIVGALGAIAFHFSQSGYRIRKLCLALVWRFYAYYSPLLEF